MLREDVLFIVTDPPEKPWTLETDCLHHKAFKLLLASLSPGIYPSISHYLTAPELIHKMFRLFYSKSISTTTKISRDFHLARHRAGVPISKHLLNLNAARAELAQRGEVVNEESMKSIIINSLNPS